LQAKKMEQEHAHGEVSSPFAHHSAAMSMNPSPYGSIAATESHYNPYEPQPMGVTPSDGMIHHDLMQQTQIAYDVPVTASYHPHPLSSPHIGSHYVQQPQPYLESFSSHQNSGQFFDHGDPIQIQQRLDGETIDQGEVWPQPGYPEIHLEQQQRGDPTFDDWDEAFL